MKIGILGGTFDPIHVGHLIVAEESRDVFNLDRVLFIPAKIPPHKLKRKITAPHHRLEMLKLALADNTCFDICDWELNRSGPSYTIDTLKSFDSKDDLFLLMGHDSFLAIETWHNYEEFFKYCQIVVSIRPGSPVIKKNNFSQKIRKYFDHNVLDLAGIFHGKEPQNWTICFLPIPGFNISASSIRKRIKLKRSIRYLVPADVERYIFDHRLYVD